MPQSAFVTGGTGFIGIKFHGTRDMVEAAASRGVGTFIHTSSDRAIRELGYRTQAMQVAIKDNYDCLVKEELLAESR